MTQSTNSKRPLARTLVRFDPHNPYTFLGVSPLATIEEINARINKLRSELMAKRREKADGRQTDEEQAQIMHLQKIEKEIGAAKARAKYDDDHPLTDLLTVQPGPRDQLLDPQRRADLASVWLLGSLGSTAVVPSPHSAWLFAGAPLDPELTALLRQHQAEGSPAAAPSDDAHNVLELDNAELEPVAPLRAGELNQIQAVEKSTDNPKR